MEIIEFITTSKKIFQDIPPIYKSTTNTNFINATSIITINQDYLLAPCLWDSLLSKIKISNGPSSSVLRN